MSVAEHRFDDFRVVYLSLPAIVDALREDFTRAGAESDPQLKNVLRLGKKFAERLARRGFSKKFLERSAAVYFYSDVFAAVRELPKLDADLIIVDERLSVRTRKKTTEPVQSHSHLLEGTPPEENVLHSTTHPKLGNAHKELKFEDLQQALASFTAKDFHYPSRRILVVIPESSRGMNRAFQLGLSNVRAVITEPASSVELFLFATHELEEFRRNRDKTSVCFAGGGLEGYIYALGATAALDDCFEAKKSNDFDIYCGVSSGAIMASSLAGGMTSDELMKQLYKREGRLEPLSLSAIFDFATGEVLKRVGNFLKGMSTVDPAQMIARLRQLVPLGLFRGDRMRGFIERQLARAGVPDNISALKKPVFISATDLDTGEHVIFGEKPWQDVKLSQAIRASAALPPFYLPERINGHWFTDGQLKSSYNFNSAIKRGAGLVLLIDPMVAYSTNTPGVALKHGGYFVAVQAVKSLVESRSVSMLSHAMDINPDVDFVVFRPTDEVMEAMAGNPMHYRIRTELAELGYRGTILQILDHYEGLSHRLAKHGFPLKTPEEIKALLRV